MTPTQQNGKSQEDALNSDVARKMLQDLTSVYSHENREITVKFDNGTPRIDQKNDIIYLNPDSKDAIGKALEGPQALRVILDTLCHEVAHANHTRIGTLGDLKDDYGEYGHVAATVGNILEDQYIDRQRLKEHTGLTGAHAFKIDKIMANGHRRPPLDSNRLSESDTYIEALTQIAFAGKCKNLSNAPDGVKRFVAWVQPKVDEIREIHDVQTRETAIRAVIDKLVEYLPEPPEAPPDPPEGEVPEPPEGNGGEGSEGEGDGEESQEGEGEGEGDGEESPEGRSVDELLNGRDPENCTVKL